MNSRQKQRSHDKVCRSSNDASSLSLYLPRSVANLATTTVSRWSLSIPSIRRAGWTLPTEFCWASSPCTTLPGWIDLSIMELSMGLQLSYLRSILLIICAAPSKHLGSLICQPRRQYCCTFWTIPLSTTMICPRFVHLTSELHRSARIQCDTFAWINTYFWRC